MNIKERFEEQVFFNTALIENITDGEFGTGFLIQKRIDKGYVKQLLFSNKHVFWGKKDKKNEAAEKDLKITFHKKEADGSYKLGTTHSFTIHITREKKSGYFEHPDAEVDVACQNVSEVYNTLTIGMRSLDFEEFTNFNIESIFA